jgi:hypothetical protein
MLAKYGNGTGEECSFWLIRSPWSQALKDIFVRNLNLGDIFVAWLKLALLPSLPLTTQKAASSIAAHESFA